MFKSKRQKFLKDVGLLFLFSNSTHYWFRRTLSNLDYTSQRRVIWAIEMVNESPISARFLKDKFTSPHWPSEMRAQNH